MTSHLNYFGRSAYRRQLDAWLAHFPPSQLMVVAAERLFAEPLPVLRRVERFLGLAPHEYDQTTIATKWRGPNDDGRAGGAAGGTAAAAVAPSASASAATATATATAAQGGGSCSAGLDCEAAEPAATDARQQLLQLAEAALHEGIREFDLGYADFLSYAATRVEVLS